MTHQKLYEQLELLLSKSKYKEVRDKLELFKEDSGLTEVISSELVGKELRNLSLENTFRPLKILNRVVMADYPIENPIQYSSLYTTAITTERFKDFSNILAHLKNVSQIESPLVSEGIQKNQELGRQQGYGGIDKRPYVFESSSYMAFMEMLLREDTNLREKMIAFDERLARFEFHLKEAKEKEIDIPKLFSLGYTNILRTLDSKYNFLQANRFPTESGKVLELLRNLDKKGFNIYHKSSIDKISKWLNDNSIDSVIQVVKDLSTEALLYVTGLHLKSK